MKMLKWTAGLLLIIGGINLGLLGLSGEYNLLSSIFGTGWLYRTLLVLIGLSTIPWISHCCCPSSCRKSNCDSDNNCCKPK